MSIVVKEEPLTPKKMSIVVKEEPMTPKKTPPYRRSARNEGKKRVIVIDSSPERLPRSRNTNKNKRKTKKPMLSQWKQDENKKASAEGEEESEEESILDSDLPITFTEFLCASDPVRGYYTIWNDDALEEHMNKCETPAEIFALLEKVSQSDIVNASVANPPIGGVPGLVEITHKDLSMYGRMCLMRWATHVEIRNGEPKSGEKEDAVEVWNRMVRILKKRFVNGVFRKRKTIGKKK